MEQFTVEQFQQDFDSLIQRVENGESFIICDGENKVVVMPTSEYNEIQETISYLNNHDDAC